MHDAQKKVTAWTALALVTVFSASLLYIATLAAMGALTAEQFAGRVFLSVTASFHDIDDALKVLCSVILAGLGILGTMYRSTALVATMSIVLLLGAIASVVLLLMLQDVNLAAKLWQASLVPGTQTYDELRTSSGALLISSSVALSTSLATFLGISVIKGTSDG